MCHPCWAPSLGRGSESNLYCPFGGSLPPEERRTIHNHNVQFIDKCTGRAHCSLQLFGGSTKKPRDTRQTEQSSEIWAAALPALLRICGLWQRNTCGKVRIQVPPLRKTQGNRRTTEAEARNGRRIGYSLAGLPRLENWGDLKGIVLNLHHSPPSRSTTTLLKNTFYTDVSQLWFILRRCTWGRSSDFQSHTHAHLLCLSPGARESLKQTQPRQKLRGPDVRPNRESTQTSKHSTQRSGGTLRR